MKGECVEPQDRAAVRVALDDRRTVAEPPQTVVLTGDAIEVRRGKRAVSIPLSAVTRVRFGMETAGTAEQAVCRVRAKGREIAFGSQKASGQGEYADNGEAFRRLVVALHEALRPRFREVEFVRGESEAFRWMLFVVGLAIAAVSLVAISIFAWDDFVAALGTVPFALIGLALAIGFRPGSRSHYDPEALIEELSDPLDPAGGGPDGGAARD